VISFDHPVASSNSIVQPMRDDSTSGFHEMLDFHHSLIDMLGQKFIELNSQLAVEYFKSIFKKQLEQSTSTFHSFVSIVIPIIQFAGIIDAFDKLFHHQ